MRGQEMENMTTMAKMSIIRAYCSPNRNSYLKSRIKGKFGFDFKHLMAFLMLGVSALLREMQIWIRYQNSSGNLF